MKKWFLILSVVLVFALQCKKEPTRWSPELAFPIASGEVSLYDFINPDYLENEGDFLSVSIQETITPVNLDDLLDLGDTIIEQVYTPGLGIGPIPFGNSTNIFSIEQDFGFDAENAKIRYVKIKSGAINFSFKSDVDGYLDLEFLLPGITLNGEVLEIFAQTEPATNLNLFESSFSVDVSGYEMDLTGQDGTERNSFYGELSVATSESPEYIAQIYGSDEIVVEIELENIVFDEVRGFFGTLSQDLNEEIEIDIPGYAGGSISLEEINLDLEIKNYLGVDAIINLDNITATNQFQETSEELNHSIISDQINFTRAFETPNMVFPDIELLSFNSLNSNLAEFISITPNQIGLTGFVELNPLGDLSGGNDFYRRDYPFEIDINLEIPLCLAADTLILIDTLDVNLNEIEDISNLILKLNYDNHFEFNGELEIFFPDQIETLGSFSLLAAPSENTSSNQISEIELETDQLETLQSSNFLVVKAKIFTENGQEIKIQADHKIDIILTAVARYEASF